eukprot:ANDGO_02508.mRNA.1 hypothetical protein
MQPLHLSIDEGILQERRMSVPRDSGRPESIRSLVVIGSCLSVIGGYLNGFSVVQFSQGLTSMTGNLTNSAASITLGRFSWHPFNALAGFFSGSLLSGIIIKNQAFHVRRRYGVALMFEAAMLMAAGLLLEYSDSDSVASVWISEFAIACAAAVQNSSFTTFSSAIVRSTHITGMVADVGSILGHVLWYKDLRNIWKLQVFIPLILSFYTGAILGALGAVKIGVKSIYIAASATFLSAAVFILLRALYRWRHPKRKGESNAWTRPLLSDTRSPRAPA